MLYGNHMPRWAAIAQSVEHRTCNAGVGGSNPSGGSILEYGISYLPLSAGNVTGGGEVGALVEIDKGEKFWRSKYVAALRTIFWSVPPDF